jgi:hypothetical protein
MFHVYAPVNDANKGEKEKFWKNLWDVMTFVQRMVTQEDREAILHYFCVSNEFKKIVLDVKVKMGVEIGSCHYLVLMRMDEGRIGERYRLCIENLKSVGQCTQPS